MSPILQNRSILSGSFAKTQTSTLESTISMPIYPWTIPEMPLNSAPQIFAGFTVEPGAAAGLGKLIHRNVSNAKYSNDQTEDSQVDQEAIPTNGNWQGQASQGRDEPFGCWEACKEDSSIAWNQDIGATI